MENTKLTVKDISGSITNDFTFVEKTNTKGVIIQGLLLPKDKISRNNVLYDWESIKAIHRKLIGKPVMYNHLTETADKPVGHYIDSWLKEQDDEEGPAGWYYKANLDNDNDYTKSVLRGDLRNVSIQVVANASKQENTDDGKVYTRAYIGSILEASLVPCPGYEETSIEVALAEAFKSKESGQTTQSNPGATTTKLTEEEKESTLSYEEKAFFEEFTIGLYQNIANKESKSFNDFIESAKETLSMLEEDRNSFNRIERIIENSSLDELEDILKLQ
jgi:hypothetical protein